MRRASIAEAKAKLSREWIGHDVIELTANNVVIATINPANVNSDPRVPPRTGVAAPTVVSSAPTHNSDSRVPHATGVAALSKTDQASGKSRR